MAVNTSNSFFDLLKQCELLNDEQFAEARELAADSESPKDIARLLIKQGLLTSWQASMLVNGKSNMHLGKYRLLEQLSSSEMGHVFHAEHSQMGRPVALRVLSKLQTKDPQAIKRFLAEARQIAALDHRNLIHVYDVDSEGERYYLVSEYVEGEDLQKRIDRQGPLSAEQAARYVRQAALGLAHAHEQNILHGDVKPSNLLVDSQDSVRVLDVGVARIAQANGKLVEDETSAKFRAPEQAAGEDYDQRADIYSLGRTLYYLLTGQVSLSRDSGADVGLLKICQKMIAKDADERMASAQEAAEALAAWLEKQQGDAAPTGGPSGGGKSGGKNGASKKKNGGGKNGAVATNGEKRKPPIKATNPRITFPARGGDPLGDPLGGAMNLAATPPAAAKEKPALPQQKPAGAPLAAKRGGLPPWAFLAGAGALVALMLLVGLGVGAYMLFGPTGGEEVASADSTDAALAAGGLDPSDPEYVDPEAASPKDNIVDPEAEGVDPEASPPTTDTDAGDTDAGNTDVTDPAAADPKVNDPSVNDPSVNDPAVGAGGNDTPDGGGTPVASTDGGASPEQPMPVAPEPDKPPKSEPPKTPDPKKPATPPKKEQPKPAPPQNPFRNLAHHIALPVLDTSDEPATGAFEPQPLGDLFVKPGELFFVDLHGGEAAFSGSRTFGLVPNLSTERDWDVVLSRGAAGDLKVGALSLKDEKLRFQWTPEAKEDSASGNFANCVLAMRTGIHNHWVSLRVPQELPPMDFELTKTVAKVDYQIDAAPEPDKVMVEIAALEGFPEHVYDPEQAVPADGETTFVRFGQPPQQVLSLKIDTKIRKGIKSTVTATATAHFKLEGMPLDVKYSEKDFRVAQGEVNRYYQQAQFTVTEGTKRLQKAKGEEKKFISQKILEAQNVLTASEAQLKQLEQVDTQLKSFQPVGKVHFRIYINAGEYQIDLVRSNSLPKPPPAKTAKPAAK
ncbi:MAG: protein kinase [Pirellulaceae bacterium]